ncbi:uncharacterized protein TNCT_523101 [Trichonephila clavata]|uniref:Uncharacterized protein n=1 Tax=Trichonephila clavata TaxID=2740835 RepID=A0A8X6LS97_TRICU|nr:uncharacterized protein TNCT_523101 [Trichonephila clavata]
METVMERPFTQNEFRYSKSVPKNDYDFTYRRVCQAANLISYDTNPCSITKTDFSLKSLEPRIDGSHSVRCGTLTNESTSPDHSSKQVQYENFHPLLLQQISGSPSTFSRVMQGADKFPNYINQKSVTKTDFHPKPFDINDYVEERSLQKGMNPYYSKEISTILSSLRQKSSKKHLENKHTDLEKNVNDTNCTFLRAMQAVDWKNPEPIPKTMYETDFSKKCFCSPSRTAPPNPVIENRQTSHRWNDLPQFNKALKIDAKNANFEKATTEERHLAKKEERLCSHNPKKSTHTPKFQYSEPLLFHSNYCEKTTPLVNKRDVAKQWSRIVKNTQGKQDKANYKLDGKCLPCYQKNLSPSEDRKQIHVHNSISAPLQTDKILEASREPKWVSKLENINPNLFRRDDYTDSTNKRIHQAANVILSTSDKQPLSETKESFQKTQDLLPEAKAAEQKAMTAVPRKAKSSADFVSPKVGEFPFTKESYLLSTDLHNIITGDAYLGYCPYMKSVTASDFHPIIESDECEVTAMKARIPKSPPWPQFRKTRSQLADLHCPKREGIHKFMDDEDRSLQKNNTYKR